MKRCVILTQGEWERLPVAVAARLADMAEGPGGFTVTDKETGEPITDQFRDWLTGVVALAFGGAYTREMDG